MKTVLVSLTLVLFATAALAADAAKELDGAAVAIRNMTSSHQIPSTVLASARCVAVIPNLPNAGIIVAGKQGGGVVSCRTRAGWSAPAFITITGGSVGFQAGIERQDLVLLMNKLGRAGAKRRTLGARIGSSRSRSEHARHRRSGKQ